MQKRYLFAGLIVSLILVSALILLDNEQRAASDEIGNVTTAEAPDTEIPNTRSAIGFAPVDSPNSSTNAANDEQFANSGNLDVQLTTDALSVAAFPELSLPPDIGMHEEAAVFASEGRDPEWSTQMEGRILDRISQAGITVNTMQAECRESLCRVYISHPAGTEVSFSTIDQMSLNGLGFADGIPSSFFGFVDRLPVRIIYLRRYAEAVP